MGEGTMNRICAWILLLLGGWTLALSAAASDADVDLADFDQLWDYAHPDSTEAKFRALLPEARNSGDSSIHAQLLTQIARTQGLQRNFEDAHATLDEVDTLLHEDLVVARVRYLLERGRVFNSSKHPEKAKPLFLEAWELAKKAGEDFHAVDAAHMMGIIEPAESALEWNRTAIKHAEDSENERAQGWLGSLYNNVGWTYHDQGDYDTALEIFQKALAWRQEREQAPQTRIAKWCVARCLRSLERIDEALVIQEELLHEYKEIGETSGYVHEELGECLLSLGRNEEAKDHFALAYIELSKDPWLAENEPDRIARLKDLGGVPDDPEDTK